MEAERPEWADVSVISGLDLDILVQKQFSTEGPETAPKYAFQGLTRSSATAAKQRVSYAGLSKLANNV